MPDNPYMVVGSGNGPSYSAPLLDWQGIANGIGNNLTQGKPQAAAPQPGAPTDIRSPAQMQSQGIQPNQGGQPNQMQGLGARLMQWLSGQQGGQPGGNATAGGTPMGGMAPMVPSQPGPTGIY